MKKHAAIISAAALAMLLSVARVDGSVIGELVRVGYPGVRGFGAGSELYRPGEWVPVLVRLSLDNADSFDGWIRVSQPDSDGDLGSDRRQVHLRRDQSREYWLYVLGSRPTGRASAFTVEVVSDDGEAVDLYSGGERVRRLTVAQPPDPLSAEDYLLLSIGETVGKVAMLEAADQADNFSKVVRVAHIGADSLPSRWQGLQSVDAVVWDRADPSVLTESQLEALIEWTRQGGTLVLAAGSTADVVADKLGSILPVDLGDTVSTAALPNFRRHMLGLESKSSYTAPMVVARCSSKKDAVTIVAEHNNDPRFESTIVARRRLQRGRVVFVAAALADLLSEDGNSAAFFKRILELRSGDGSGRFNAKSLAPDIDGWVGFKQIGATYLAVAMMFAGAYVFAATFGAWQLLRSRKWLRHSWTAFAVISLATSVASVAGVQAVRGVRKQLLQYSVVDAEAGSASAIATAYFGLKTGLFGTWDVWLSQYDPDTSEPGPSPCTLFPLGSHATLSADQHYADPARYRVVPSQAELLGVPIRGTVKQFEGRWAGSLPGVVKAKLGVSQGGPGGPFDWQITPDSTITNLLGVDLKDSYLIYAARDLFPTKDTVQDSNRADKMYMFRLGPIAASQTISPASVLYTDGAGVAMDFDTWSSKAELKTHLRAMGKTLGGRFPIGDLARGSTSWNRLERHELAILLLTMLDDYAPKDASTLGGFSNPLLFRAGTARHLEMSVMVDTRTALLIGFSNEDGPVNLCVRRGHAPYARVAPVAAVTVYRVLIPIE